MGIHTEERTFLGFGLSMKIYKALFSMHNMMLGCPIIKFEIVGLRSIKRASARTIKTCGRVLCNLEKLVGLSKGDAGIHYDIGAQFIAMCGFQMIILSRFSGGSKTQTQKLLD